MARLPRIEVPGYPLHVVVRGVDRSRCFRDQLDYACFRSWMFSAAVEREVEVHGYVCMTNHVHLMITGRQTGAISAMMQALGRKYVRWYNDIHARTGPLFEGRFRSRLIETDVYALACLRYIDLNPLRAGMVSDPIDYRWSSCSAHALGTRLDGWTPHCTYLALSARDTERRRSYRALLAEPLTDEVIRALRPSGAGRTVPPAMANADGQRRAVEPSDCDEIAQGSGS